MKELFILGFALIFIGTLLIIISFLSNSEGKTSFAFFGFIGPVPFGFANSREMPKIAIATTIIVMIIFILFLKYSKVL